MKPITGRTRNTRRRGFTLIELLIVIAILLALVGIVAGTFLMVGERADIDIQRVQLAMVDDAMERFKLDMKRYPTEDEGIEALWSKSILETEEDEASWRGPYVDDKITVDKWGTEFEYYEPSQIFPDAGVYDLVSAGPDREVDTEDDITNHDSKKDVDGEFEDMDDFGVDG